MAGSNAVDFQSRVDEKWEYIVCDAVHLQGRVYEKWVQLSILGDIY